MINFFFFGHTDKLCSCALNFLQFCQWETVDNQRVGTCSSPSGTEWKHRWETESLEQWVNGVWHQFVRVQFMLICKCSIYATISDSKIWSKLNHVIISYRSECVWVSQTLQLQALPRACGLEPEDSPSARQLGQSHWLHGQLGRGHPTWWVLLAAVCDLWGYRWPHIIHQGFMATVCAPNALLWIGGQNADSLIPQWKHVYKC